MASSQVGASPAPSRKEMLEAGKRKLLEFRKQKAEERAKRASASSTEDSQSSRIKNSHAVQQSAGNVPTNTEELNGTSFEKNPNKDPENYVFQSSHTTASAVPYSVAPSNEGQAPEVFVDNHVNAKSSAGEDIHGGTTTLSIVPDPIYGSSLQRPSIKDNDESDRRNILSSNEFDSGYMNIWRRSSLENSSELPRHQEVKTVSDVPNVFLQAANIYSNRAEQASMKDEFLLSQEKNFKDIQLGERNGREHEFKERMPVEQVSSRLFSKDAEENVQYREKMQPMTHPSLLHLADDAGMSQMDRHTGSNHITSHMLKPEFTANKFPNEHRAFGNGKHGKEETMMSGEGSKLSSSDRSNNRQSQNQGSLGAELYSDTKSQPSMGLFSTVNSRRSRPSFLDSIASSASSTTTQAEFDASERPKSTGELLHTEAKNIADLDATRPLQSMNNEKEASKKLGLHDRVLNQLEFSSSQKNDDFGALEQHIEDLTQEKFALQRALDASRTLTESLAQENSSLTEAFNQQGAVVSQLKSDLEKQQEEINAQVLVLNTFKMEFDNAQLECSAADERAKMLASEVISLEEKALRLRSNELKLERQLETVNDEVASNRHISSLEKERLDLRSTIDALQEEKKLLQSKLRKAAANGNFDLPVPTKPSKNVKEASTSTEDIGIELFNFPGGNGLFLGRQDDFTAVTPMSQSLLSAVDVHQVMDSQSAGIVSNTNVSLSSFTNTASSSNSSQRHRMLDLPVAIPGDQQRMIDNINSLIEELALEKESLARALKTESSEVTKLKASNQELSQKLESQTQRLELLISQNMAHGSSAVGPRNIVNMQDELEYVDEGDEVVERVLGWIMKLFPGGSSKRRTSKLL
ncbi:protein BLISTER isoform X3 [Cryptomeria japonica]|uniref:protein BLISTER isoform X3 n=1 Tax=Cryptomeria japonica TaxID=3369 RepID=UPI0025AD6AB8|nr:protein BLISTER isoform X3 [Cryptomeria japonica]